LKKEKKNRLSDESDPLIDDPSSPTDKNNANDNTVDLMDIESNWWKKNDENISKILTSVESNKITLNLNTFLELLKGVSGSKDAAPKPFFLLKSKYDGVAEEDASRFKISFTINVMEDFAIVPLFDSTIAITSQFVRYDNQNSKGNSACMGIYQKYFCLFADTKGTYDVDTEILVPYATRVKTGLYLSIQKAVQNEILYKVNEDVFIKVDPCLISKIERSDRETSFVGNFPPTNSLSIQWTENKGGNETIESKEIAATVTQNTLASIGDGIVIFKTLFRFDITSGQMSLFEVELEKNCKITNVEGLKNIPIKRWDVKKNEDTVKKKEIKKGSKR